MAIILYFKSNFDCTSESWYTYMIIKPILKWEIIIIVHLIALLYILPILFNIVIVTLITSETRFRL